MGLWGENRFFHSFQAPNLGFETGLSLRASQFLGPNKMRGKNCKTKYVRLPIRCLSPISGTPATTTRAILRM